MTEATLKPSVQQDRAERFHALHAQAPLVLANVWDAGSAHIIAAAGPRRLPRRAGPCPGRPQFRTETR
jgi:hypothetical protein